MYLDLHGHIPVNISLALELGNAEGSHELDKLHLHHQRVARHHGLAELDAVNACLFFIVGKKGRKKIRKSETEKKASTNDSRLFKIPKVCVGL